MRLRAVLDTHKELARRLSAHEKKLSSHDQAIAGLLNTLRSLMAQPAAAPEPKRRRIGFVQNDDD